MSQAAPKGVYKHGLKGFRAKIKFRKKNYNLGTFKTVEEASNAYMKAAEEFAGQFARRT